jgi:hypothetical protein
MIAVPRIPFLLEYPRDDADESRRSKPRENPNAKCRCGAEYSQFLVSPEYLASLTDGQRASFLESCVEIGKATAFPALCARCDRKLLGTNSRTR